MKIITNLLISLLAFAIAISIAIATGIELVFNAVFLAFAIQWIAFIPAYIFQTEKFYDLTGSLTYLSVIWYSLVLSSDQFTNINGANIAIVLLISLWAIRLGSFLFMRIHHDGEDKRFRSIKPSASQFFMTTGFTVEVVADMQKSAFKAIPANKDKFITLGLWAKSRHPNYLGEIVLWTGIAVMSFSSLQGLQYLTLISPIFTYLLLVYVSGVRMLEARGDLKWGDDPDYQNYKKSTPTLFFKFF